MVLLGFKPHAITYSSDNFQRLYDLAERLIQIEKAYVCHCNEAEIKLQRGGEKGTSPRYRCAHAEQDVETNLQKFRDMRDGKYQPQAAFLRMKQDITSGNPQNWDLAAYRVLSKPHHRTGDKWVIYPTYDFTHCIVDRYKRPERVMQNGTNVLIVSRVSPTVCALQNSSSRERVTNGSTRHCLCTSRCSVNTVCSQYLIASRPDLTCTGRLNVTGTIMSKRGLKKLIDGKYVRGWDDPRLYTLIALRRRGVPPGAILSFINELGVTTSNSLIQLKRFEQSVRNYLERTVPRLMMVLDPLPVVIEDADTLESSQRDLTIPFSPKIPAFGTHPLRLTSTVYIDRSDFREVDSKDYFRLAPGKTVGLLQMPYPITATTFTKDADGKITEVRAVFQKEGKKPKTYIQWVPEGSRKAEVRIHTALFKSEDPAGVEGGFLNDINPNSETIYPDALLEPGFEEVRRRAPWPEAEGEKEKAGPESAVDSDSTDDKVVLNRIVSLKEDTGKSS
ncbi:hypothetical protein EIK77_000112 [Talaromyces pinophilus]|nr:hypothetical protein EIK77_000112 [Talaromyces pinophilus]